MIHTASPFPVTEPADASEVVDPAKEGTLSVLKASVDAGTVRRVVITSSIVAITGGRTRELYKHIISLVAGRMNADSVLISLLLPPHR